MKFLKVFHSKYHKKNYEKINSLHIKNSEIKYELFMSLKYQFSTLMH